MSRVLVVDDDADGMEAVCLFLEKAGHHVMCKHNGREALAGLATFSPDVVILDLLMPEMDGVEFLEVLRNYYRGLTLPVVLLTAVPEGPAAHRARSLGVRHVFPKADFQLSDLETCICELTRPVPGMGGDVAQTGVSP